MSTKGCSDFLLFCLEFDLFAKLKKDLISTHSQKPDLPITQDLNKMKKMPNTLLQTLVRQKRVQKFSRNY